MTNGPGATFTSRIFLPFWLITTRAAVAAVPRTCGA
ncbi:Uncharacterised protein [Pseudomonas aeruginosa]|nr:Uncharacterised protein [Pseudomonas aeruginosa]CRR69185.1 hypothetical protein PAERUG_E16_London_17_VIM_2_04_14_06410 [Pseudomonas aeruginosa]SST11468.1 Uncharacterised protein [Acinetobacter baumannii]